MNNSMQKADQKMNSNVNALNRALTSDELYSTMGIPLTQYQALRAHLDVLVDAVRFDRSQGKIIKDLTRYALVQAGSLIPKIRNYFLDREMNFIDRPHFNTDGYTVAFNRQLRQLIVVTPVGTITLNQ